jgi:transcriptional regulator with XRE-family HTH domain
VLRVATTRSTRSTSSRKLGPQHALALRIKELRALQGLTQEEAADRIGIFRTYMSRIESGQANPTLTMLYEIAAAFAIPVQELFEPVQSQPPRRVKARQPVSRGRAGS